MVDDNRNPEDVPTLPGVVVDSEVNSEAVSEVAEAEASIKVWAIGCQTEDDRPVLVDGDLILLVLANGEDVLSQLGILNHYQELSWLVTEHVISVDKMVTQFGSVTKI